MVNLFKPIRIAGFYQLDQSILVLRVVEFFFIFITVLIEHSVSNSADSDQTPHSAASELDLHCLSM